jgi:hypothetical protein
MAFFSASPVRLELPIKRLLPALIAFNLLPTAARAEVVIHVPADQPTLTAAVAAVPNGGTIELAAGTYASPAAGFALSNLNKGFTVRAAPAALVYLDGGSARPVLRIENSSVANGRPIVFERIVFRNGSSPTAGVAGGVTIKRGEATFVDCTFDNNQRLETTGNEIAGGGAGVAIDARAFFVRTTFDNNRSKNNGGGLSVSSNAVAYVHESEFYGNRTDVTAHRNTAAGGGISVVNAKLYVSNSRFEGNRAGYVGGAIYGLGSWIDPVDPPSAEIWIANSTFVENEAFPNGVATPGPTEAGAVHAEDETTIRIFHSRFVRNAAQAGGAVNLYRAIVDVDQSVFYGNRADPGGNGGFGGALNLISNDTSSADPNRRSGSLAVRRSYVRGTDPPAVTSAGESGGCLAAAGDFSRRMGLVTPQGSAASTRATVVLEDVVLNECDVTAASAPAGGGFDFYLAGVTFSDALVLSSSVSGAFGSGGGGRITSESDGELLNVTFARNVAADYGGAMWLQGSSVDVTGSRFVWNEISPGTNEPIGSSTGAAIFSAGQDDWPTSGVRQNQTGIVSSSVFSENVGLPVFDDDRNGAGLWINDLRYNSNTFYNTTFGTDVYTDSLSCCHTAADLNSLVVNRVQGNTDKSQTSNSQPGAAPVVKDLRIVPTRIVEAVAAGDAETSTVAYAGYAWSGGSATLDGGAVAGNAGATPVDDGSHTLSVSGQDVSDLVDLGPTPAGTLTATPAYITSGGSSSLAWQTGAGDFVAIAFDQGLTAGGTSNGAVLVSPTATTTYRAHLNTEQGGVALEVTVFVDEGDPIFLDGFESNGTGAWSATVP